MCILEEELDARKSGLSELYVATICFIYSYDTSRSYLKLLGRSRSKMRLSGEESQVFVFRFNVGNEKGIFKRKSRSACVVT